MIMASEPAKRETEAVVPSNESRLTPTAPPGPNLPTMFGEILETSVTFCVDTSGSMYNCLHVVQEQLIETLHKHARRDRDTLFNIIEFNTEVTQWADKMVKCTPETVAVAAEWINKLSAKTGTNTQDALLTAFSDPKCRAVYLVTDGLPDQQTEDILDHVAYVNENRPVHCIYICENKADEAATEFLEDLSFETYGSFHIVTMTTHGCVERITPVYRADHAQERLIRTVEDHVRPNVRTCSVTTTLNADPEEALNLPRVSALNQWAFPPYWYPFLGPFPQRYYYPHYWSRYRPAKAWLKAQDSLFDPLDLSPAAGALLIGKKVMARRIDDGYFYMGTVQSQILQDKFLVGFGPCKHGKYRDTSYQDTYVYDIVDLIDAKRHTILTGDRVLAPWEPEGERYGPGIVIDGHERRDAEGPDDSQITVTFSNGKTEKVPEDLAVWIPEPVYERLALELKMPRDARETLQKEENYPQDSLPGYPGSGPVAYPPEFPQANPLVVDTEPVFMDRGLYRCPPYVPTYPVVHQARRQKAKAAVKSEDMDAVIPGTNMTRKELQDKVSSQLNELSDEKEEKVELDEREIEKVNRRKRLLKKREKQFANSCRKSVSFDDSVQEAYFRNNDVRLEDFDLGDADSGYATSPDLSEEREKLERKRRECEQERRLLMREREDLERERLRERDVGVNTDSSLLFRKTPPVGRRPPWRYWKRDPSPGGRKAKSATGPFRETALQAPLEARDQRNAAINSVEWRSPVFKYVDPQARGDYSNSVELLLKMPKPPSTKVGSVPMDGEGVASSLGYRIMTEHDITVARREFRRQQIIKRRGDWQTRLAEENSMKLAMQDQHHQRILEQLTRERDRQLQEQKIIANQREAKKKVSVELRQRIEKNQQVEATREEQRISALRNRREHREAVQKQHQKEVEAISLRRQQIKVQRCQARADAYAAQLDEEDSMSSSQMKQAQSAKANRVNHFRHLEEEAQRSKDLRMIVTNMHQSMLKSQIFP
ncbi:uncharacterized protein [Haliotis cracherodii]|uniref:uncharacterized protein n=1 Tax=Haliotis cracherodii TaxID=6455 RepID=UPI0039EAA8F8